MDSIALFWARCAAMFGAGVPAMTVIEMLTAEADGPLREALIGVREALGRGEPLSTALAGAPEVFEPAAVALIGDAETRGAVLDALRHLAALGAGGGAPSASAPRGGALAEVLDDAIAAGASDLHFEPTVDGGQVRLRIDGSLQVQRTFEAEAFGEVLAGLKALAHLEPGERGAPRSGLVLAARGVGAEVDMRVSVGPTVLGESAHVRLLEPSSLERILGQPERIFPEEALREQLFALTSRSHGLFLVTGPSGCGKSTSAYALVHRHDAARLKVITVEDPVEVRLSGVHQIPLRPATGFTAPQALRHALTMDPDVLFCADIRDAETATTLLRIALTGHVVYSQLHSRDPVEALMRLVHLGLEPFLLADALNGILAQRLVRRLCPDCRAEDPKLRDLVKRLPGARPPKGAQLLGPVGCPSCNQTGYRGRRPIYELMEVTERIRAVLIERPTADRLRRAMRKDGARSMFDHGLEAVYAGETSIAEVLRVCAPDPVSKRSKSDG